MRVRHLAYSFGFVALVVVCSTAVHPFGQVKTSYARQTKVDSFAQPLEVRALLVRSCQDCHSAQTIWPWYSYVPPISWLVERDVRRGRDRLNLDSWSQYSSEQQRKLLADIATVIKNHEMPLAQYVFIHPDAKLSEADIEILYQWARRERRKTKSAIQPVQAIESRPEIRNQSDHHSPANTGVR
jgi:hypothetical protein